MDIIANWHSLIKRIKEAKMPEEAQLFKIHMGCFEDLRKSGHLMKINGTPVSQIVATVTPEERLQIAAIIGDKLVRRTGDIFNKTMEITLANRFPNCIFILIAAVLENLEGAVNVTYPDRKVVISCVYTVEEGENDSLSKLLPVLSRLFSWVEIQQRRTVTSALKAKPARYISYTDSEVLFVVKHYVRVDTLRTAFSGDLKTGFVKKNDVLNVIDKDGRVLCHEGIVLHIYVGDKEMPEISAGQHVNELCLAVDVPSNCSEILLIDGDSAMLARKENKSTKERDSFPQEELSQKEERKKKGIFSRLFKNN